jgi:transglutaminase superfamily protein
VRHPPDLASLRAALWTWRSLVRTRKLLRRGHLKTIEVRDPPPLPGEAVRGVHGVLRRVDQTCLERALILQRWLAAHGDRRDVVIGVAAPATDFRAHAWLEGDPPTESDGFTELMRLPSRVADSDDLRNPLTTSDATRDAPSAAGEHVSHRVGDSGG